MKGTLVIGKVAGIKIQVHWSFTLLLVWVVFTNSKAGGDYASGLFNVVLVLVLFLCVILHELGHALMARRFKIQTRSITLLPIGGVAALEKIPEKPSSELAVALAGPVVNLIIVLLLSFFLPLQSYSNVAPEEWELILTTPSWTALWSYLFIANSILLAFNLIPAFPMDGGRVLRALLAFRFSRAQATEIASRLGQSVAFLFLLLGLFSNPFLVLVAVFVYFGAYAENQMVQQQYRLQGHLVRDALITNFSSIPRDASLKTAISLILSGTEKDFMITEQGRLCGLLLNSDIVRHAGQQDTPIAEIMETEFATVSPQTPLTEAFQIMNKQGVKFLPVLEKDQLIGAISSENIGEFLLFREKFKAFVK